MSVRVTDVELTLYVPTSRDFTNVDVNQAIRRWEAYVQVNIDIQTIA